MPFCSNCGAEVRAGMPFCGHCGSMVAGPAASQPAYPPVNPVPNQAFGPAPATPKARLGWLRTTVYVAVLLAIGVLFFALCAGFYGYQQMRSWYRHPEGFFLKDLPPGARELADRYVATQIVKCGGAYYLTRWNPKYPDSVDDVFQTSEMTRTIAHNGVDQYEKMNGLQDRVSVSWTLQGPTRRARFQGGKRASEWGPWGPPTVRTTVGLGLLEKNNQWSYVLFDDEARAKTPPLTCAAVGAP